MTVAEFAKLSIAAEHLDAAMQMYLEQKFFSAIHLAGAAAELFDLHLPEENRIFRLAIKAERGLHAYETGEELSDKDTMSRLNLLKNSVKHMNDGARIISIDPIAEASWWIEIAHLSSFRLGLPKTQIAFRYDDYRSDEIRAGALAD